MVIFQTSLEEILAKNQGVFHCFLAIYQTIQHLDFAIVIPLQRHSTLIYSNLSKTLMKI